MTSKEVDHSDDLTTSDVRFPDDIDWDEADVSVLIAGMTNGMPEAKEEFDKRFLQNPDK